MHIDFTDIISACPPTRLTLSSASANPDLAALVGKAYSYEVTLPNGTVEKRWGMIVSARQGDVTPYGEIYHLELRPWLWLLRDAPQCAVYQNMTVPEIVKKAAGAEGFHDIKESLSRTPAKREYVVQYNESTYDFLCRIMAEDGIFFFFSHDAQKHTLVLADSQSALATLPKLTWRTANTGQLPDPTVWDLRIEHHSTVKTVRVDDYNYLTPETALTASVGSGTPLHHTNGLKHPTQQAGESVAKRRLAALDQCALVLSGKSNATSLMAGGVVEIGKCPNSALNTTWALASVTMRIDDKGAVDATFTAVKPEAVCPPLPARPRIAGPMTGIVCGQTNDEIYTDQHGRVKVLFHWDRQGKADETASCWLRVAQDWAGNGYGTMHLPRVGQEVLVQFIDGDPDRPVVIGCLYNATNKPPWQLPTNKTFSGIKGRSSPKGEPGNEIFLDDVKDKERLYFHAQKLLECLIEDERNVHIVGEGGDILAIDKGARSIVIHKGDDSLELGEGSRQIVIKKGNHSLTVSEGNGTATVSKGDYSLAVSKGSRNVEIGADDTTTVKGKQTIQVKGDYILDVTGNLTLKAGGKITIQSSKSAVAVSSQAGTSIDAASLSADAKSTINLSAKGQLSAEGAMLSLKGKASGEFNGGGMTIIKGGIVKLN